MRLTYLPEGTLLYPLAGEHDRQFRTTNEPRPDRSHTTVPYFEELPRGFDWAHNTTVRTHLVLLLRRNPRTR